MSAMHAMNIVNFLNVCFETLTYLWCIHHSATCNLSQMTYLQAYSCSVVFYLLEEASLLLLMVFVLGWNRTGSVLPDTCLGIECGELYLSLGVRTG